MTFCICFCRLGERSTSPVLERVALCRNVSLVDGMCLAVLVGGLEAMWVWAGSVLIPGLPGHGPGVSYVVAIQAHVVQGVSGWAEQGPSGWVTGWCGMV